ncbi:MULTISPECIES: helix-turn-helix domain-containing protein [Pseudomonas]|uniref:helix-turn-helix domain-containing protein n=1 Tax=Pseudomonas TaxID=286 RepID=UPI000D6F8DD4|nr:MULTISPECIES: helix-turn-helix transcriptional regulator [unclassified Pseudomonas]MED5607963.1 helix-turn-helix transcriptional regulator [Pseudomonas sp. JH-2]PWU26618.1 XRE family transcriptional regulator [Pseudomonas sp. RW407]
MNVQVITRDGEAEYAVLPWADYQALLAAAGARAAQPPAVAAPVAAPSASWRELREARGLSLESVAREVGISPSYLGMIESGEREVSEAIEHGLRRALGAAKSESAS